MPYFTDFDIQVPSDAKEGKGEELESNTELRIRSGDPPHLQTLYESWPAFDDKSLFADILSVLAMTYSDTQPRGTLRYRLWSSSLWPEGSPLADPGTWGHEYVRHPAAELGDEYTFSGKDAAPERPPMPDTLGDLRFSAKECAVFLIGHNAEPDALELPTSPLTSSTQLHLTDYVN
ncbi:hypothetical protein R3P38DRAFT_3233228 [Favolaschia claudopus]|uniref:RPN1 N-terminal domain-containing protein n=1 Tax=Favolaschia claudopus TaxID=2862362 RepID=A0AAV9ZHU0_9AGAR